jgi:hypothetical protein
VEDEGSVVVSGATIQDYRGSGVTVTDQGGGRARVTIPGADTSLATLRHRALFFARATKDVNTVQVNGWNGQPAGLGTGTFPALSTATFNDSQVKRRTTASSTGTNQNAGYSVQGGYTTLFLGDAAGIGGFSHLQRFAFIAPLGVRGFMGIATANGVASSEPSAKVNILGVGWDTSETTFQLLHNDGSGTATKTDTTVTFAVDIVYELEIECQPNSANITVSLYSVDATGRTLLYASGVISTNLPSGSTALAPTTTISNGAAGGNQPIIDFHFWVKDPR